MIAIKKTARKVLGRTASRWLQLHDLKKLNKRRLQRYDKCKEIKPEDYPNLLKKEYEEKIGHPLNLDNPVTYMEKMQWRKLYDRNPMYSLLTNKIKVKEWVEETAGKKYVIPTIKTWKDPKQIDFSQLPKQFVLKTNNGSGTVIVVKDKEKIDKRVTREQLDYWLKIPFGLFHGFELQYIEIEPMILAEQFIEEMSGNLYDYKIHCFHGEPKFIDVMGDRDISSHKGYNNTFDINWNKLDWTFETYPYFPYEVAKPKHLNEMLDLARVLSKQFDYVRVDLYDLEDRILFGEMTFTPSGGLRPYMRSWTYERDVEIGKLWHLDTGK